MPSLFFAIVLLFVTATGAAAQEMPAEYKSVLDSLARTGDFNDGVLKVNIPRNDLKVTVAGVVTPTPFGFGGWVALTKGTGGVDVMMGDLVLTQDEVNPVMSAVLAQGLDVTALHKHFFWESPRMSAFFGSDTAAVVAGDVAMVDTEVTPVLKALRDNGIEVVAIHHHMTATQPTVIFLHYWGQGPAERLATAVRAAINQTGPRRSK